MIKPGEYVRDRDTNELGRVLWIQTGHPSTEDVVVVEFDSGYSDRYEHELIREGM